ncbi:zinc-dependent alcohol dehydrogenase family protein [Paenibacillus hamazuiensis]|uniref:zinc-dependent alcohol dehydrogenase family protein n=1 Tax=Paenibacillus hamazuiensis TaxID=2936508 RepID=UPI00200CB578|nr:NAD(P)-dependent alcohol dehydrogenase [Paenibacillus hamazuiensis]
MKSYHVNLGAGLEGLLLREHDMPVPGPGEVLVRVRACSLNFREIMILFHGSYTLPIRPDVIPVSDGAGEIVQVGEGVTKVKAGDRVAGVVFPHWLDGPFRWENSGQLGGSLHGMLTEYAVFSEEAVVRFPDHLSFEEAATLPCAAVTAWNALTGGKPLEAGQAVLTLGSGGVSLFAIQLAKLFGARVIATTSSMEKAERLKALGADDVIDYNAVPNWHITVRELTEGRGADCVVEVGGAGTLEKSIRSAAADGQISQVGWLAGGTSSVPIGAIAANVYTLRRIAVGSRSQFIAMNRAIALSRLKPVIDRVFPFEEASAAFAYLKDQPRFGKVVIKIG